MSRPRSVSVSILILFVAVQSTPVKVLPTYYTSLLYLLGNSDSIAEGPEENEGTNQSLHPFLPGVTRDRPCHTPTTLSSPL